MSADFLDDGDFELVIDIPDKQVFASAAKQSRKAESINDETASSLRKDHYSEPPNNGIRD